MFRTLSALATVNALSCVPRKNDAQDPLPQRRRILLLTDLDGTLVDKAKHNPEELEAFNRYWNEHERPRGSVLVYNTARCIKMYTTLAEQTKHLMPPDVLITGEGTEIRWMVRDERVRGCYGHDRVRFVDDAEWKQKMRTHWWDSGLRDRVRSTLDVHDQGAIAHLNDIENALPHGEARHAVTLTQTPGEETMKLAEKIERELGGSEMVRIFHMEGWIKGTELMTAIPSIAGKDGAAKYVASKLMFQDADCLAAGDTKGDASMLMTNLAFIAVGNATSALRKAVRQRASSVHGDYMSPFGGAGGVLDGLLKFVADL